ncbi:MAG: LrgB family protein [Paraglaciecola sp.]|uniref:LrgB family protein n=1 Tax=Paraglaciecola sp. TaxID=1920173 RepID=UPI0032992E64
MLDSQSWPYLESGMWVFITFIAYMCALYIFRFSKNNLMFHPIVIAALMVAGLCIASNPSFADYALYSSPMGWLLGPITVALAVPVYQQLQYLIAAGWRGFWVVLCGGILAPVFTILIMSLGEFSTDIKLSSLTKSITTPLAIDTTNLIGGVPELAAAIVIITGLMGVLLSRLIFKLTDNNDQRAQGLVLGTIAHAIGTSHALQLSQKAGVYSSLALCINGLVTAIVLPLFFYFFGA